jgi:pimeloyl-ACP methyl ester carboxylesterase
VLAAVQGPVNAAAFQEPLAVTPAWRQLPSWYQVSAYDRVINPDLQRLLAERIGATTLTLDTGHASPVTRATDVARLIRRAAASLG